MLRDILTQKGLSNREAEVAELVVKGLSNKEVANQLFVTEKTVKFHLTNIYKKMNVKSRAQLIVWCMPYQSFVESSSADAGQQNNNTIPAGNTTISNNGNQGFHDEELSLSGGAGNLGRIPTNREPGSESSI
jgi:LuxR family transcriptional regulator, positive regulator of biofilm formation